MRILHVVPYLPKASGVTTFVVECSDALQKMGVEQVVAVKDRQHFDVASSRAEVPRIGVEEALARIGEFDVVHLHGIWPPFLHRFVVAARRQRVLIVWSLHGMLSPWAMKFKWWKKTLPWLLWQKRDLTAAAILHVTSEKESDWVRACGFRNRIVNIPLGTDMPEPPAERRHQKKTLLFVGRINPVKGLENLIQAWKFAQCADWKLRLVGTDEAKYTAKLMTLAQNLSLQSSIEFPGPKFGKDLDAEYQNADAFVLPSFTENFGGVVVDALAWGLPVITSKGTPWREVEGAGEGGRGTRSRLTAELHTSPSASHFVSFARFKDLAEKRPEELTFEEKSEIVHAIETTEMICLEMPKDEKITRFLKGYWDGDAKVIREIVDWGSGLVPVRVINRYIGEIQTHKNSIRSTLFHTRFRGPLKVLILERLADVLKDAVLYNKGRDGDETFYNLAHRLRFDPGDGKPVKEFIVRLIVKENAEGNRTWTVEFSNKKELTGMPTTGEAATVEVTHLKSPSTHTILKLIYAVNAGEEGRGARSTVESNDLSRCGWWVDNDPETLAKALREAMSLSDEERRQMGEVGRQLVEAKYTWAAVAKKMGECYESLKV